MITLEKSIRLPSGIYAYRDDTAPDVFYLMADSPRFRVDEQGRPYFQFLKYAGDREDAAGALCIFDVELTPWPEQEETVRAELAEHFAAELGGRPARLATPVYLEGKAKLLVSREGKLVEEVVNEGRPSLVGRNVTSFNVRLSPAGAQVYEKALSKDGGMVQVVYELIALARLGGLRAEVSYDATQVLSLAESVRGGGWEALEKALHEDRRESRAGTVRVDVTGDPSAYPADAVSRVRDWALKALQEQQSKELAKLEGIGDDERKRFEDEARAWAALRGLPYAGWWYWHWYATNPDAARSRLGKVSTQTVGYHAVFDERSTVRFPFSPQGMLPTFARMGIPWEAHSRAVTLDDPFFRRVRATLMVNADFDALGIATVQVHVRYAGRERSWTFTGPDAPETFSAAQTAGPEFAWWFVVNYRGSSAAYRGPERTATGDVSINVGSLGVLSLPVVASGLVFGDDLVAARVEVRYADPERRISVERQLTVDASSAGSELRIVAPIGAEVRPEYEYRVVYDLADTRIVTPWEKRSEPFVYVESPFTGTESLEVAGEGLGEGVSHVDLTLVYDHAERGYRRTKRLRLTQNSERVTWTVPVREPGAGRFFYEATVVYDAAGARPPRRVARTAAEPGTVYVGDAGARTSRVAVAIRSAAGLWDRVDAVSLDLRWHDPARGVTRSRHFDFELPAGADPRRTAKLGEWELDAAEGGDPPPYSWSAEYVLSDGSEVSAAGTGQGALVLRLPENA